MKAGLHIALFLATVYDYFFKKQEKQQPDSAPDLEDHNQEDLPYTYYKRYNSMQEQRTDKRSSLFDFEDDEQDGGDRDQHYTALANDELEKWQREKDAQNLGIISRIYNGSKTIMLNYARRRNEMNQRTIQESETLSQVQDYMVKKKQTVQRKIHTALYARNTIRTMKKQFGDDFMTL